MFVSLGRDYVSELRPPIDLFFVPQIYEWVYIAMVEIYWREKTEALREKTVPLPLCPPQIPTWTDSGANPGLCGERSVTNRLSHGTAMKQDVRMCSSKGVNFVTTQVTVSVSRRFHFCAARSLHSVRGTVFANTDETACLGRFLSVARGSVFHLLDIEGFAFCFVFQPSSHICLKNTYVSICCRLNKQSFISLRYLIS
jgi:hypothetical protein